MIKKKILIIDDEESVRESIRFILDRDLYEMDFASDGKIAIQKIDQCTYDAYCVDMVMPGGIDGMDVIKHVRSSGQKSAIVILTANKISDVVDIAYNEYKVYEILTKPIDVIYFQNLFKEMLA